MDFTGGFVPLYRSRREGSSNYRESAEKAFISKGAKPQDIQVREMTPQNHLRILFGTGMEQKGSPFYGLELESTYS